MFLLLYLIGLVNRISGADILVCGMLQGKSHLGSMVPLLTELARQDHPFPLANDQDEMKMWQYDYDSFDMAKIFYYSSVSCKYVMEERMEEFRHIASHKWDLFLTDSLFGTCGYGLASMSKVGHVIMHTSSVEQFYAMTKSFGRQYTIAPPYFMDSWQTEFDVRKFRHRLAVVYEMLSMWFAFGTVSNYFMKESLTPVLANFDFSTYARTASMSFTDMPLQIYSPEPLSNELFSYGAYCTPHNTIDGELADFVNDLNSEGTILLAFGTILRLKQAPRKLREAYMVALNQLINYRIIWACNDCPLMKVKKHIRVVNWVPQTDLLHHPKTKLFITHGGLKSVKEAICAKMPALFMPIFGEQVRNAWLAKKHHFGRVINRFNLTSNYLLNLIRQTLDDPSHKEQLEKMRRYFDDAPISPLKEGAFRISHLLKYGEEPNINVDSEAKSANKKYYLPLQSNIIVTF
uniref:UDP-glucuronosyltransferase n=1 Tax=Setaria digitata TaxID=48799 RepID=A0A915PUQ3_9BILA